MHRESFYFLGAVFITDAQASQLVNLAPTPLVDLG
jgi:hypothetical protein